jgi:hypothetical protein
LYKLVQEGGRKMERKNIYGIMLAAAVFGRQFTTLHTCFFKTVFISAYAKTQLQKVFPGTGFIIMVHHHAGVVAAPVLLGVVPAHHILNGTWYVLLFKVKQVHRRVNGVAVGNL